MTRVHIPAPVDVHVHLREPGYPHKEDLRTGTQAALAGGFTAVLDMPNTSPSTATLAHWQEKARRASRKAVCDVGFFVGATTAYPPDAHVAAAPYAAGLKIYINETFGSLRIEELETLWAHMRAWPGPGPIAVHAEGLMVAAVVALVAATGTRVHFCHVSRRDEILLIKVAKERGLPITCEVTPHHLFLSTEDLSHLGPYGIVKPPLASREDQQALWEHLDVVDCFATDHAPHTKEEKESPHPPPGMPGLETALPLLLTAVVEGRITLEEVVARVSVNPRRIFHLPADPDTHAEVVLGERWTIGDQPFFTRARWSPFTGVSVRARVHRTVIRGQERFRAGEIRATPGSGKVVTPTPRVTTSVSGEMAAAAATFPVGP